MEIAASVVICGAAGFARAKILRYSLGRMHLSEHHPAQIDSALARIDAALERITRAARKAQQARLETASHTVQLEVRHEILREKVNDALASLDGLIARVEQL